MSKININNSKKVKRKLLGEFSAKNENFPASTSKRQKSDSSHDRKNGEQMTKTANIADKTSNLLNQKGKNDAMVKNLLTRRIAVVGKGKVSLPKLLRTENRLIESSKPKGRSRSKSVPKVKKVSPIIETRAMKAKKVNTNKVLVSSDDIDILNRIDLLTAAEIAGEQQIADEISHDGVVLSIHGSDDEDDFPEVETTEVSKENDRAMTSNDTEPGEISSSDKEDNLAAPAVRNHVASKVTKVSNHNDRFGKFDHLRQDPDFKSFLNEVVDERMSARANSSE